MREKGTISTRDALRALHTQQFELSVGTANEIMASHGLTPVVSLSSLGGFFTNSNYLLEREDGTPLILKIEHRPGLGSLRAELASNELLRKQTDLPVANLLLVDVSQAIIPHSYMITERLPGQSARSCFEAGDSKTRLELISIIGRVLAVMHGVTMGQSTDLPLFDLNEWRTLLASALLDDRSFKAEIQAHSSTFYAHLTRLLEKLPPLGINEQPGFTWRNPALGNLLVEMNGKPRLSGIFDFQTASRSQQSLDCYYAQGDFGRNRPEDGYGHPEYGAHFMGAYREAGGQFREPDHQHELLRRLVLHGLNPRIWWNILGVLHPLTPEDLKGTLNVLKELEAMQETID